MKQPFQSRFYQLLLLICSTSEGRAKNALQVDKDVHTHSPCVSRCGRRALWLPAQNLFLVCPLPAARWRMRICSGSTFSTGCGSVRCDWSEVPSAPDVEAGGWASQV